MNSLMKTNYLFPLSALFIGLLMVSCFKNDGYQPPVIHEVSKEFREYTIFDSASYWVYQHDQNLTLDTVKIKSILNEKRLYADQSGKPAYYYYATELNLESKDIDFAKAEISAGETFDTVNMDSEIYRLYFGSGRYFSIFLPKHPMGQTQLLGINEGNYMNLAFHDKFYLFEKEYDSVYETTVHDYHDGNDTVFMHFFIARHYGLVKMTRKSNAIDESWSLFNSSLSQFN